MEKKTCRNAGEKLRTFLTSSFFHRKLFANVWIKMTQSLAFSAKHIKFHLAGNSSKLHIVQYWAFFPSKIKKNKQLPLGGQDFELMSRIHKGSEELFLLSLPQLHNWGRGHRIPEGTPGGQQRWLCQDRAPLAGNWAPSKCN